MNWRVKGVIQKVLSHAPGGLWVNDRLQTAVGELKDFNKIVDAKVTGDWLVLAGHFRTLGVRLEGLEILEIGSGWFPTLPFCFYLAGVRSCRTYDLTRHMNEAYTVRCLRRLELHLEAIAEATATPLERVRERYQSLTRESRLESLLEAAAIHYMAPADASRTGLTAGSIDLVYSNSVFEHVPGPVIAEILKESERVLRPGGISVHSVACNDHYAHFDKSITFINYLQYSERQWWWWNNSLNYQNRLRAPEFLDMAERAGLEIIFRKSRPHLELMGRIPRVAAEFAHFTAEDLCTLSIDFIGRKNQAANPSGA